MAAVMMMASAIVAQESASDSPLERDVAEAARSQRLDWWHAAATDSFTESNEWVSFDLNTVLLDTLENSPRIQSENSLWWPDAHWRYSGDDLVFIQGIIRPGIGRRLNDENSIWAGYAWIGERIPGFDIHENRFWQQWITTRQRGDVSFQFRSRLEQRFVSAGAQVGWRFRQLVRAQKPLEHHPDLLWVAWDEIFFHLRDTDWGAVTGYNQNRVFVGMGRIPNKRSPWRTEIGYLYQQIDIPEDGADLNNHILSVNFYFNP
mgnify:CR=1 FL=1